MNWINARKYKIENLNWNKNASDLTSTFERGCHNKSNAIKPDLLNPLESLDKRISPSKRYKILSTIYTAIKYHF